jgi:phospholipid/cholesterol/gamma-HCH transport system substrate-binding protein
MDQCQLQHKVERSRSVAYEHVLESKRIRIIEASVGLFTLLGLLAFAYLAINVARMKVFNTNRYKISAEFDNISGLKIGAPVEIAGVQIGDVDDITLNDTSAKVILSIQSSVPLRSDDIASVRTKGIIGDKYVKISPGASQKPVAGGSELRDTESTVDLEDILGKLIHRMDAPKEEAAEK